MSSSEEIAAAVHAAKAKYLRAIEKTADEVAYLGGDYVLDTGPPYQLYMYKREELVALKEWLAWAPTEATPWWPGGWRLRVRGRLRSHGGVGDLGVWATREDLVRWLDSQRDADGALPMRLRDCIPEWGPLRGDLDLVRSGADLWPEVLALDVEFWQQHQPEER